MEGMLQQILLRIEFFFVGSEQSNEVNQINIFATEEKGGKVKVAILTAIVDHNQPENLQLQLEA